MPPPRPRPTFVVSRALTPGDDEWAAYLARAAAARNDDADLAAAQAAANAAADAMERAFLGPRETRRRG